ARSLHGRNQDPDSSDGAARRKDAGFHLAAHVEFRRGDPGPAGGISPPRRPLHRADPKASGDLMRLKELGLRGAYLVDVEPHIDERGLFARTWSADEFAALGLVAAWVQSSTSYNRAFGTLRGLHYQAEPRPEAKLVRCTRGAVFDVIVDLRVGS